MGTLYNSVKTSDGENTWLNEQNNPITVLTALKTRGDSLLCVGGGISHIGSFYVSINRGSTWYRGGHFGGGNPNPTSISIKSALTEPAFKKCEKREEWLDNVTSGNYANYYEEQYVKR
jgi:hypothetical protein